MIGNTHFSRALATSLAALETNGKANWNLDECSTK